MTDALTDMSAGEITRRVRDGDVSPTAVVDAHLERKRPWHDAYPR